MKWVNDSGQQQQQQRELYECIKRHYIYMEQNKEFYAYICRHTDNLRIQFFFFGCWL